MLLKTFENNGKNCKNIVKLNLEQNIKFLLYNHLVYICGEETAFWQFYDNLPDKTENSLSQKFTIKGHN